MPDQCQYHQAVGVKCIAETEFGIIILMKKMILNDNRMEDRESDWLAQERKYEAGISAWDIDDPKSKHSMSRDALNLKLAHSTSHDEVKEHYFSSASSRAAKNYNSSTSSSPKARIIAIILIAYVVVFMFVVSMIMGLFF